MKSNIHVLFQFIQMITLLGEFILEGMEPVKWELLANTLNQGCRLGCTVCKGMVDVLFPLLFVDIDILLGLFTAGETVTGMGLAFAFILCTE